MQISCICNLYIPHILLKTAIHFCLSLGNVAGVQPKTITYLVEVAKVKLKWKIQFRAEVEALRTP